MVKHSRDIERCRSPSILPRLDMAQRAATFTEVDVRRAIRAAGKAGFVVRTIEITKEGTIRLLQTEPPEQSTVDETEPVVL
jgi:hypothetical protein